MRRIVPPYTLNACAAAALPAALEDEDYYQWYCAEVRASKRLLYDALSRFGVPFWPSDGNFVLARFGDGRGPRDRRALRSRHRRFATGRVMPAAPAAPA
jgi:histidinol-phosphate aminotransferase